MAAMAANSIPAVKDTYSSPFHINTARKITIQAITTSCTAPIIFFRDSTPGFLMFCTIGETVYILVFYILIRHIYFIF